MLSRTLLALATLTAFLTLALAPGSQARPRTCKPAITIYNTKTYVITLKGTTCAQAKRAARAFGRGTPPRPWLCALSHAPFDRINGHKVLFSCGYGSGPSNLRKRAHSFVGAS